MSSLNQIYFFVFSKLDHIVRSIKNIKERRKKKIVPVKKIFDILTAEISGKILNLLK